MGVSGALVWCRSDDRWIPLKLESIKLSGALTKAHWDFVTELVKLIATNQVILQDGKFQNPVDFAWNTNLASGPRPVPVGPQTTAAAATQEDPAASIRPDAAATATSPSDSPPYPSDSATEKVGFEAESLDLQSPAAAVDLSQCSLANSVIPNSRVADSEESSLQSFQSSDFKFSWVDVQDPLSKSEEERERWISSGNGTGSSRSSISANSRVSDCSDVWNLDEFEFSDRSESGSSGSSGSSGFGSGISDASLISNDCSNSNGQWQTLLRQHSKSKKVEKQLQRQRNAWARNKRKLSSESTSDCIYIAEQ